MPPDFQPPPSWDDYYRRHKPVPPEPPGPAWPNMPELWCLLCSRKTLIPLCWYLFQRRHYDCTLWACYSCKGRTRNGLWIVPDPSIIHDEAGLGDTL